MSHLIRSVRAGRSCFRLAAACAVLSTLVFGATVAWAEAGFGVHVNNGSQHGIGDGANIDGHVHPFITCGTQSVCLMDWTRYVNQSRLGTRECTCNHLHDDVYPSGDERQENASMGIGVDYNAPDNSFGCHQNYHQSFFGYGGSPRCNFS